MAPLLVLNGPEWFKQWGTEKSPGTKLMCISGEVKNPATTRSRSARRSAS
jgi:NADH-quinone oxidoreductase subunit F